MGHFGDVKFVSAEKSSDLVPERVRTHADGTFVWCHESKRLYLIDDGCLFGITPSMKELERRRTHRVHCSCCGGLLPMQEKYTAVVQCPYCSAVQDVEDVAEVERTFN